MSSPPFSVSFLYESHPPDIFETLIFGEQTSTKAVRRPSDNGPVHNTSSPDIRCNVDLRAATETVTVEAGAKIGFKLDKDIYHQGPASMYLGRAPGAAAAWDGSGKSWFKVRPSNQAPRLRNSPLFILEDCSMGCRVQTKIPIYTSQQKRICDYYSEVCSVGGGR